VPVPSHGASADASIDPTVQRRTVRTLVGSQVLGGIGVSSGIAVGSLLAEEILGSADLAGLGGTFQVLGGALIAIPMARVMAARGRRPGLVLGLTLGIAGALVLTASGVLSSFALLLLGSALFGGATATNSQARYAAADLAEDRHRGRDLSVVVWATTIGAVLGPNLIGLAGALARTMGLPSLTGPFLFSLVGFVLAAVLLAARLRPDPLLLARARERANAEALEPAAPHEPLEAQKPHGSVVRGLRVAARTPAAALGLVTVALGHAVMVSVMVMTPLHMHHGGAELRVIGLVISIHILGMFAFSPLVGLAVDRFGARPLVLLASGVLVAAALLAAQAPTGWSAGLTVALFLLGLGWSGTLVSGSTLIAGAVPVAERAGVQGASDLAMGLAAGGGGALAGVVVAQLGYGVLGLGAAALAAAIAVAALLLRPARRRQTAAPTTVR
jgi:MFS family permease